MRSPQSVPELPTLDTEVYRLTTDQRPRSILASLVVDHALLNDGPVYWIDALNHATTDSISAVAPSVLILNRIQVARGFTPYQHAWIAEALLERAEMEPPSLIVAPALDALYRESMTGIEGSELLARTVSRLARLKRQYDCPVLLTTTRDDELSEPIAAAVSAHLECEQTPYGPRFVGDDFETLVYPVGEGLIQTTIAYWQSIIEARKPLYSTQETPAISGRSTA